MKLSLGVALIISALAFGIQRNHLSSLIYMEALVLIVGITAGLITLKFGPSALMFWKLKKDRREQVGATGGITCLLAGLIVVLENLDSPDQIGPGIALSILGLLYSSILYLLVFLPMEADKKLVKNRIAIPSASLLIIVVNVALIFISLSMPSPS